MKWLINVLGNYSYDLMDVQIKKVTIKWDITENIILFLSSMINLNDARYFIKIMLKKAISLSKWYYFHFYFNYKYTSKKIEYIESNIDELKEKYVNFFKKIKRVYIINSERISSLKILFHITNRN